MCTKFTQKTFLSLVQTNLEVKVTRGKKWHVLPFWRLACGLCLVKHLWTLVWFLFSAVAKVIRNTTTTTVLRPFIRDHPGEPVPEENFWTLWCKGRLTEADALTIRLGATPSGLTSAHLHHPPIFFYGPDALPAAQPTVSKH